MLNKRGNFLEPKTNLLNEFLLITCNKCLMGCCINVYKSIQPGSFLYSKKFEIYFLFLILYNRGG